MAASATPCCTNGGDEELDDKDIADYVAIMFVLHYLAISDDLLRTASKHAAATNNSAFELMASQSLISYSRVENKFAAVSASLAAKLPSGVCTCIKTATQWRYTDKSTHVVTGPNKKQRLKHTVKSKALKTMARAWILEHRHAICSTILKPCRAAAKHASLAPDTYYRVTRELALTRYRDVFTRAIKEALTGRGDMALASCVSL